MDVGVLYSTVPIFGELGQISQIRISSYFFINYGQLLVKFSARSEHFFFGGSKGLIAVIPDPGCLAHIPGLDFFFSSRSRIKQQ
jgi:hypothetical protein